MLLLCRWPKSRLACPAAVLCAARRTQLHQQRRAGASIVWPAAWKSFWLLLIFPLLPPSSPLSELLGGTYDCGLVFSVVPCANAASSRATRCSSAGETLPLCTWSSR